MIKNLPANAGDAGDVSLIPELRRSPGGGLGHPRQHSCLENSVNKAAWRASVQGVAENRAMIEATEHFQAGN